jgi:hypothetical protein
MTKNIPRLNRSDAPGDVTGDGSFLGQDDLHGGYHKPRETPSVVLRTWRLC